MKAKYIKTIGLSLLCFSAISLYSFKTIAKNLNKPVTVQNADRPAVKKIQLALLLDTSNSMDGLINQAKNQLWETISHLSRNAPEAEIEIALYHYGNDGLSIYNDYVDQVLSFTNNLDKVSNSLFGLRTNGGSEYCGSVINKSTQELLWDNKATTQKVLVIAGNESFAQGKVHYSKAIAKAIDKSIQVNTIYCGNPGHSDYKGWKKGAINGRGQSFTINQNTDIQQISTPYDDAILKCNTKINDTYIPIYEEHVAEKAVIEDNDLQQEKEQKERLVEKALIKKNKNVYKKDSWDAVDNYMSNSRSIAAVRSSGQGELNAQFKDKSDEEIQEIIEDIKEERDELHEELKQLEIQRQKYITENKKQQDENTLGKQLVNAILK